MRAFNVRELELERTREGRISLPKARQIQRENKRSRSRAAMRAGD